MDNWQFKRELDDEIIRNLLDSKLFKECLKKDILKGEVFPAIRNNSINFYYCGGSLFEFNKKGFNTHVKYASVYNYSHDYVNENNLKDMKKIDGFSESYEPIKANCKNYTSIEPYGVSKLYKFSPFTDKVNQTVLLDVEISFKKSIEEEKIGFQNPLENTKRSAVDRVDILLYDTKDRILHFIEAKHFSNGEIWSTTEPKVVKQVNRYDQQLSDRKNDILAVYKNYISLINKLFDLKLSSPVELSPKTGLYIFGFDADQEKSAKELKTKIEQKEIPVCIIGNPSNIKIDELWKKRATNNPSRNA